MAGEVEEADEDELMPGSVNPSKAEDSKWKRRLRKNKGKFQHC
jgi:hypothetical protein